jgi:uncharacterized protein HemX
VITRYVLPAVLVLALGLGGWGWWHQQQAASLRAENLRLEASLAAMEMARDQAREAAKVAHATAKREQELRLKSEAIRDAIREIEDDPTLPQEFRDIFARIRANSLQ